jgi:hypothetical protein
MTNWCCAAAQVGAMLPTCIQLASRIVSAGESVVANNARCTDLVQHVAFIEQLLHRLQAAMARCGVTPQDTCKAAVIPCSGWQVGCNHVSHSAIQLVLLYAAVPSRQQNARCVAGHHPT